MLYANLAANMIALCQHPESQELRKALKIGVDVLSAQIRQQKLRNWIDYLVLPSMSK